jgi:hypothetical protein
MSSMATAFSPIARRFDARAAVRAGRNRSRLAVGAAGVVIAALPLVVPQGPENTSLTDVLIVIALGAVLLWASDVGHRFRFPYAFALGLFMAGGALGAMAGPVPAKGILALSQDLLLLAFCWMLANIASSPARLRTLLQTWAYSSIAWALILFGGLLAHSPAVAGQTARNAGRAALTFHDPNVAANYYVVSMMIICATQRPRRRRARLLAYGLLAAAVFTTGSNSGAVSLVVAVAVTSLIALHRRWGTAAAVVAFALVVLCGFFVSTNVSLTDIETKAHDSRYTFLREGIGRGEKSVSQRETLVHESAHLYETGGLLGQGPVSTKTRLNAEMAPFVKEAHNDYFAALTERGPIGLFGLFLLLGSVVLRGWTVAASRLRAGFDEVLVRPGAIVGAVAATLVASGVYELLHVRHVWALFALVAAMSVWGKQ